MIKKIILILPVLYFYFLSHAYCTIKKNVLSNNLVIVAQEISYLPLINIDIYVKGGATSTPNSQVYEYVIKHLLMLLDKEDNGLFKFIQSTGGETSSTVMQDMTRYSFTFAKEHFDKVLLMIKNIISMSDISDILLQQAIENAQNEIRFKLSIPEIYLSNLLFQNAYTKHKYKQGLFPTENIEFLVKKDELLDYIDRYLSPSNLVFIITGDIKPQDAIDKIKNIFDEERFRFIDEEKVKEPPLTLKQIIIEKNFQDTYLGIAFRAPKVTDIPDVYIMDIILTLLGEGKSSRLWTKLVEEKKLCKDISAEFLTQKYPGLFKIICTLSSAKNIDEVKENILEEIYKLKKGNISPQELQKSKDLIENLVALDTETLSGKASYLGFYEVIDNYQFALTYLDEINKITAKQVRDFANKIFQDKNYIVISIKKKEEKSDK